MNLLNINNPFWRFLGKLFDVVVLNLLWTIFCIPIITIGPTTTAVYYVCIGLVQDKTSGAAKAFFRAFQRDWKQSIPLGLLLLALAGLLGFDLWYFLAAGNSLICVCLILLLIVILAAGIYAMTLLVLFENSIPEILKNALILALRHPVRSVGMLLLTAGFMVGAVLSLIYFPMLSVVFLIFGPALVMFLHCLILFPIIKPYLPDEAESE